MHNILYDIITKRYETGDIHEELVESRSIAIAKKITNAVIIHSI